MEEQSFGAIFQRALQKKVPGEAGERLRQMGYEGTWMELLSQAQLEKAAKGDTAAFRLLRDTLAQQEDAGKAEGSLRSFSDDELWAMLKRTENGP